MNLLEMFGILILIILVINALITILAIEASADNDEENVPYLKIHKKKFY